MKTPIAIVIAGLLIAGSVLIIGKKVGVHPDRYQLFVSSSAAFRLDKETGDIEWCIPEVREEGIERVAAYVCKPITEDRFIFRAY